MRSWRDGGRRREEKRGRERRKREGRGKWRGEGKRGWEKARGEEKGQGRGGPPEPRPHLCICSARLPGQRVCEWCRAHRTGCGCPGAPLQGWGSTSGAGHRAVCGRGWEEGAGKPCGREEGMGPWGGPGEPVALPCDLGALGKRERRGEGWQGRGAHWRGPDCRATEEAGWPAGGGEKRLCGFYLLPGRGALHTPTPSPSPVSVAA